MSYGNKYRAVTNIKICAVNLVCIRGHQLLYESRTIVANCVQLVEVVQLESNVNCTFTFELRPFSL